MHTLYIACASMMNVLFSGLFDWIGMDILNVNHISDNTHVHTNSPIIVYRSNSVWTLIRYVGVFSRVVSFDNYPVLYLILIRDSFSIFSFVIDFDQSLFAFFDVFPISIMSNVEKGITPKH